MKMGRRFWIIISGFVFLLCVGFIVTAYYFGWPGTGFTNKTLWDWLQLLIVPLALALIAFLFNLATTGNDRKIATQRYEQDQHIALDKQREDLLQTYLDRMSELLLEKQLRSSAPDGEVRNVARVRTIALLFQLDARRVGYVFAFLREAGLISDQPGKSVVGLSLSDLSNIDLSQASINGADFSYAKFNGANLSGADLTASNFSYAKFNGADLSGADLTSIDLRGADFTNANLSRANLGGADLTGANLIGANLIEAYLSTSKIDFFHVIVANLNGTDLTEANFTGANLTGVYFRNANLSHANFSGANLSYANFTGANHAEANFSSANLIGANYDDTHSIEESFLNVIAGTPSNQPSFTAADSSLSSFARTGSISSATPISSESTQQQ
jgi:uncharacterized protein YjbI with pentapeptide repeats